MPQRSLSKKDMEDMNVNPNVKFTEKRKGGDRRVAINSCIDPKHDRRVYKRRRGDRKGGK